MVARRAGSTSAGVRAATLTRGARCALAALMAFACNKESPPTAEQPRAPTADTVAPAAPVTPGAVAATPATPAANAAPAPAGSAHFSEVSFELGINPKGAYESGKPAEAEIVLEAKPPFHVNDKYPYKFKLKDESGLSFPAPVVTKDAVKLEKARATMAVPFTAQAAGKHNLSGQFSFSLCTDDKCLIEKRDLSLVVDAK